MKHCATLSWLILLASLIPVSLIGQETTRDDTTLDAHGKHVITPEDLVRLRQLAIGSSLGEVQISPDGARVAFEVFEPVDPLQPKRTRSTSIWIVPTDGSAPARPFAASPQSDRHPRWSPDSRFLAFVSDRSDTSAVRSGRYEGGSQGKSVKNQIYLQGIDGRKPQRLTNVNGDVLDLKWSPNGRTIAFTMRDTVSKDEEKRHEKGDDAIHVDFERKYVRLWLINLADRKPETLTKQDLEVADFTWSPDGKEFAVVAGPTPRKDDVIWHSSLVIIACTNGKVVRTLSNAASTYGTELSWSPDGKTIAFAERTPNNIAEKLSLIPAALGPVRHLLEDYRGTMLRVEWEPDSKHLVGEMNERTKDGFLRIDISTEAVEELQGETSLPGADFSITTDGHTIAYLYGTANNPGDVYVLRVGEAPRRLTNMNPETSLWHLGQVREINWKSSKDGQVIYGVLVTPPAFKPGEPYPMVVQVHGGPEWAWWSGWLGSWHEWAQLLASNGYVVFLPNPRGSTGQGWQFQEANRDDWGGGDFQDIMDGVDVLIEQKIADPDHLGIGGWSFGGFMTSWAITHSNRFKAAVVGAAITDLFSFDGTTDITPSFLRNYFLDVPFHRRAAYEAHSPINFLQNCTTPSLIVYGDADQRVPVSQGWEFFNGLKMLHVSAELVIYPRETHEFEEPAHQIDLLKRVLAWFDKYLKQPMNARTPNYSPSSD